MAGLSFNVHETIDPLCSADEAAITLLTTNKALIPTARYNLGTQYFNKEGRKLKIAAFGKMTTGATPGNLVFELLFGTNADANGASLCASAAITLIASQTNIVWGCEFYVQCRSKGAAGTLFGTRLARGESGAHCKHGSAHNDSSVCPCRLCCG
jgi:hypothetical protein